MQLLIQTATDGTSAGDHRGKQPPTLSSEFAHLEPPVIVVGMHRSGTSMVVGMLHALGVYMDPELSEEIPDESTPGETARTNGYGEAVAFRLVNESVMKRADAVWDDVDGFLKQRDSPRFAATAIKLIAQATHAELKTDYLDRSPFGAPKAWGWKDPRTSLTLPYWLHLFPHARILHVVRDPDRVIASLQKRDAAKTAASSSTGPSPVTRLKSAASDPRAIVRGIRRRLGIGPAPTGVRSYAEWRRLTDLYVSECKRYTNHPAGYLEVSYEEILNNPIPHASMISEFAGACAPLSHVLRAASFVLA